MDAGIFEGFAGCQFFVLVEVEGDRILSDFEIHPVSAEKDTGKLVFTLAGKGVNAVLLQKASETERQIIAGAGMQVYIGARGTAWDTIRSFIDGRLEDVSEINPCTCEQGRGCGG